MSITAETAKEHAHDPAVLCCRAEGGITIEPANLEDPAIFDDLVDSGLLNLDGCLTIEEVLGAKLKETCDSLCPLTADKVEGAKAPTAPAAEEEPEEEAAAPAPAAPVAAAPVAGGTLKIHIGEGKDIDLEIPVGALGAGGAATAIQVQCALDGAASISVFNPDDPFLERARQTAEKLKKEAPECKVQVFCLDDENRLREEIARRIFW